MSCPEITSFPRKSLHKRAEALQKETILALGTAVPENGHSRMSYKNESETARDIPLAAKEPLSCRRRLAKVGTRLLRREIDVRSHTAPD
jgi:hypothetical protein